MGRREWCEHAQTLWGHGFRQQAVNIIKKRVESIICSRVGERYKLDFSLWRWKNSQINISRKEKSCSIIELEERR